MKKTFTNDLLASIVVFLVALPLCMGISIASGVPPALGLITGIVGGLVVGSLAGSPLQVSGPAAGLAVLVWELVRDHGIEALGPVLLLAGALQLTAGSLKLGQWFRAMSPAVIHGMLAGIGVLIFASQFHVMLDDKPKSNGLANLLSIPGAIVGGIFPIDGSSHELAAVTGILTILSLLAWNKFKPEWLQLVPGALVGVVVATCAASLFGLSVARVNVPSNLLDVVHFPDASTWSRLQEPAILGAALVTAFIASAETLLSAAAVDRMQQLVRTNYDRELAAQGIGNMICGVFGALPMTGVIVRSSANVQAGARTRLATILHGTWLLAFVAVVPWLLRTIPTASLGAVLVYTGYKLVNPKNVRHLMTYGRFPVVIYFATLIGIVVEDLLTGVLIGVGLTLVKLVHKITHLSVDVVRSASGNRIDITLSGAATVLRLPKLAAVLDSLPPNVEVHMHLHQLTYIDHSCLDLLFEARERLTASGSILIAEWDTLRERFARPIGQRAEARSPSVDESVMT